ncbi:glycosyltransferase [Candidatus Planktophila dulcis]|uniref:glycosyltransferase n=1 Tax=Candidatus Planktophila dulcis TaxID=1884914 RepID=UPI000BACA110|nr:glycosyltransferase [Candidatus Planktophila dulcis]ASY20708.1 glycosyltransferase [Candidatus Planktophila dulcis]
MSLAPIAIFAFNRPDALARLLDSLKRNPEAGQSRIYIFIDGARSPIEQMRVLNVERVARDFRTSGHVEVIKRTSNLGLAKSIISGIDRVFEEFDSLIVLEDDLVVAENFLRFCNVGLDRYADVLNVASIQGFTHELGYRKHDVYFMMGADCWGWATWKNRWQEFEPDGSKLLKNLRGSKREAEFDLKGSYPYTKMLERQALGLVDSWAIRWHASMFLQNRLSLYPSQTLVENYGQDGSGTHIGSDDFVPRELTSFQPKLEDIPVTESAEVRRKIRKALREKYGTYSFFYPKKYSNFLRRKISDAVR